MSYLQQYCNETKNSSKLRVVDLIVDEASGYRYAERLKEIMTITKYVYDSYLNNALVMYFIIPATFLTFMFLCAHTVFRMINNMRLSLITCIPYPYLMNFLPSICCIVHSLFWLLFPARDLVEWDIKSLSCQLFTVAFETSYFSFTSTFVAVIYDRYFVVKECPVHVAPKYIKMVIHNSFCIWMFTVIMVCFEVIFASSYFNGCDSMLGLGYCMPFPICWKITVFKYFFFDLVTSVSIIYLLIRTRDAIKARIASEVGTLRELFENEGRNLKIIRGHAFFLIAGNWFFVLQAAVWAHVPDFFSPHEELWIYISIVTYFCKYIFYCFAFSYLQATYSSTMQKDYSLYLRKKILNPKELRRNASGRTERCCTSMLRCFGSFFWLEKEAVLNVGA